MRRISVGVNSRFICLNQNLFDEANERGIQEACYNNLSEGVIIGAEQEWG